jgi:putative transcriptional regulator
MLKDPNKALMDFYPMTDKAICTEIGSRLKDLRLRRNLTQQQVAQVAAVSLNVIKSLEMGKGKLSSLVAVLRELEALGGIKLLICKPEISPVQLAKLQGKKRLRATGTRGKKK